MDAGFLLLCGSVCCACLGLGFFAIARGGRFKARGRIQIHHLHAEGEVESSPPDKQN